jgi:hypothetical protein
MKLKSFLSVIFSAAMVLHAPYCAGQGHAVFYGASSNSIGVSFIDASLSASAKSAIVSDLRLCLQEWGKRSELIIGADEPDLAGYLNRNSAIE